MDFQYSCSLDNLIKELEKQISGNLIKLHDKQYFISNIVLSCYTPNQDFHSMAFCHVLIGVRRSFSFTIGQKCMLNYRAMPFCLILEEIGKS